ncbi:hypothetical protein [Maribacter sp. ACAM166]|uniref:hypothetical protein n=1 Tax=Maribacter sp. ACAM166 TaxID=2508996 RepID=UPI0010FD381A|nr:hypothetical protein [Maribacter sp. ACAM166]TLP81853.1 hypothetical protein ES765_04005 [Maribacter sp. ACAM166]
MIRIPVEKINLPQYDDNHVIQSWEWFMSFMSEKDWQKRKADIENKIAVQFKATQPFSEPLSEGTLVVVKNDVIGWYLYLLDMLINEPHKYEFFQGSRIVPIFKRFGLDLDLLRNIGGVEKKIKELIRKRKSEADAFLFEIMTALLWARNGYQVAFLDEKKAGKTSDIIAKKDGETWSIECKRQSKTSDYTYRENTKRQKMVSYISKTLLERNILLDIEFHVELESLPDTFLKNLLEEQLKGAVAGKIVSNANVDIELSFVDMSTIKEHLENNFVKDYSPMLHSLIGKKPIDNKGFTCGISANFFRIGDGNVNNVYISDINNAFGVYCSCDAKEALWAKARDIKNQVHKAMLQFNSENKAVIHVGMETFDGPQVEKKRFDKIKNTIGKISTQNTNLRWIFCSFFQAYSRPDEYWVFDETVSTISPYFSLRPPLNTRLMIVPEDEITEDDANHWDRPLP